MAALTTGWRLLFPLGEVLLEMAVVIEENPRAPLIRIAGKLRMALLETGELDANDKSGIARRSDG